MTFGRLRFESGFALRAAARRSQPAERVLTQTKTLSLPPQICSLVRRIHLFNLRLSVIRSISPFFSLADKQDIGSSDKDLDLSNQLSLALQTHSSKCLANGTERSKPV